jgi:hypothetical protein
MPDSGLLFLSLLSVVGGAMFVLFPDALMKISGALNRTLAVLDERLMRYRYILGVLLFLLSYGLFRVALLLPGLGR